MPTIAIDYTPAYEQSGGIGRYVRDLVAALGRIDEQTDYRLFVAGTRGHDLSYIPGNNFVWRTTRLSPKWLAHLWYKLKLPVPAQVFFGDVELYHATDFVLPPLRSYTRSLLTVHDLSFVRVPETTSPPLKRYLDVVVPASVKRADHILADSRATKEDLITLYNTPPEKITVLLSGVDARFKPSTISFAQISQKYNLPKKPYILSIGTIQPRKNYTRLIQAVHQLRQSGLDVILVIAGGRGWLESSIYTTVTQLNMQDHVHFIGFADDQDLPALYTHAACFAFPSLYEGFGLPVLESMACGTPVLTSNISSLPEVAGDVGLMVDPYDVNAIADGLRELITDDASRQKRIEAGFAHIQNFTWEKSARQLRNIYQQML